MSERHYRAASKQAKIEQAIAFGRSLDWICEHLDVETTAVDKALRRMDELALEQDQPNDNDHHNGKALAPCGTPGAALRHRRRGEPIDGDCRSAWRAYETEKKRKQRLAEEHAARRAAEVELIRAGAADGMYDFQLAERLHLSKERVRQIRKAHGITAARVVRRAKEAA